VQVVNLSLESRLYTSNCFLVTGDWNASDDVVTLIDPGRDPSILQLLPERRTGKNHVLDLVLLTHSHYDHAALVPAIMQAYSPRTLCADPSAVPGSLVARHGDLIKIGDVLAEVFATPGHSPDSVSFYCEEGGILFCGDAPLFEPPEMDDATRRRLLSSVEELAIRDVRVIHFGHGDPLVSGCREFLAAVVRRMQDTPPTAQRERP
jgi:glyoxylase-like metal-dependent hydrolase (beta-lactamase superfamily II)